MQQLTSLPIAAIAPNPGQPRKAFAAEALAELTESIAAMGVVEPIVVRPAESGYIIVAGERRWRAAKAAGLELIPAVIRTDLDEVGAFEVSMVENVIRSDMNAVEEANGYQLLLDRGLSVEDISKRLGRSAHAVRAMLSLLKLEPSILDLVAKGHLTAWDGSRLATLGWNGQLMAFRIIDANHLTGNDRDRVIGQIWYSERGQGMWSDDVLPASDPRIAKAGRDLRGLVERAAKALGEADELLASAMLDPATIDLVEGIAKLSARLVREARQQRAAGLVLLQMRMEAAS